MEQKAIKPGSRAFRHFEVNRAAVNDDARTVELAFSSEAPYERWWGVEILDHTATSIRLGRLTSGGPLLMDHNTRDHIGVIESVQIGADRVGRAVVRFGKSARAEEVFQDVRDGIRRNVSVGYLIHAATLVEKGEDADTYRVTDWEPYEVSLVSVPADTTVGVGRSADADGIEFIESSPIQEKSMEPKDQAPVVVNVDAIKSDATNAANKRAADIIAIGEQFRHFGADKMAAEAVRSGESVDAFRAKVLEKVSSNPAKTADIGLTDQETRQFSMVRAIAALAATGADARKARDAAAFEIECSTAVSQKLGREARGIFVPNEVLKRDLVVGTPTAGGHTVATNLMSQDFISLLRNAMVLDKLGIRVLSGLVGNIAIPRQTGGATAYWVTEGNAPTESQQAFDQVAMSPKTVGAFTDISRKLLLQSSMDVEAFVRQDLATVLGLEIERASINGSGTGAEPRGILNTSGIGDVAGGTNGAAPSWANMVELETDIAVANAAIGNLAYLTNAKVRGKLKGTEKFSTTGKTVWEDGNLINGYAAAMTNAVPSNLTKGTATGICSAVLFGNFADLIIGLWGALDLMVDPYTNSTTGAVRVVALQDVDVALRHAESFSVMKDALTT